MKVTEPIVTVKLRVAEADELRTELKALTKDISVFERHQYEYVFDLIDGLF